MKGLPDSQLSASSSLSDPTLITNPARAKLNTVENNLNNGTTYMGAWAPAVDGGGQYVQVNDWFYISKCPIIVSIAIYCKKGFFYKMNFMILHQP